MDAPGGGFFNMATNIDHQIELPTGGQRHDVASTT